MLDRPPFLTFHRGRPGELASRGRAAGNTRPVTLTVEAGARILFPKPSATAPGARVIFGSNGNPPNNVRESAGFAIVAMGQGATVNALDLSATNVFTGNASCAQTFNGVSGLCPSRGCTTP